MTVPVTPAHLEELAAHMRAADWAECACLGFDTPRAALEKSLADSDVSGVATVGGGVLAMYGVRVLVRSLLGGPSLGAVWLLTSTLVEAYPVAFHRTARAALAEMRRYCPRLAMAVDERYTRCLRWVVALGFVEFEPPLVLGLNGERFRQFTTRGA